MARLILILVVILSIGWLGCYTQVAQGPHSSDARKGEARGKEYFARVYRVEGPDVVQSDGSFELRVFDDIECPNEFVRFEVDWNQNEASVAVIGVHTKKRPQDCPAHLAGPSWPRSEPRLLTITPPSTASVELVFNAGTEYEMRRVVVPIGRRPN